MARLQLIEVNKAYAATQALTAVDLTVEDNEFFCIFGPPGCGKTTILRLLLGLESPDSGTILIDGQVVNAQAPAERNLAMVFQNLALFPHMTARQNLEFPLVERRVSRDTINKRVAEVAEKLHIGPLLEKLPAHLSGGERQRVAIGRALVRDPAALLMDEPISALDARLREEMRVELNRLQRDMKRTLVYVTHDQEEALSVADRLCILQHGRVAQIGTPQEIYDTPASRYVAEIIGSPPMNFITGTVDQKSNRFVGTNIELQAVIGAAEDSGTGDQVIAGIRPEDVRIDRTAPDDNSLAAKIYEVEPLGAFTIVDVSVGDKVLRAQISGQPDFQPDEPVYLCFDLSRCHLFDAASGTRLLTGME